MSVTAAAQSTHAFQMHDHLSVDIPLEPEKGRPQGKEIGMFAEEEPSFWDLLDVINPLQHIPVINTLYRELTGDQIGMGARLAGGTLFGGPVGFAAAAINAAIEQDTGRDIGGHVLALFGDDDVPAEGDVRVATATAPAPMDPAPAPAVEAEAVVQPAPVPVAMPAQPTMMFTADGPAPAADRATAPGRPAGRPPAPAGGPPPRFMPVPPRNPGITAVNSPPPISVPISNSGTRSNVPITGRDPVAGVAAHPAGLSEAQQSEWFGSAMKAGLDKYEQAARLARRNEPAAAVPFQ